MSDLEQKANEPWRVESKIMLGGKERVLRLTIGQIEDIEDRLGLGIVSLYIQFSLYRFTSKQLIAVLLEALKKSEEHPAPDKDTVWRWVQDRKDMMQVGLDVSNFLARAIGQEEETKNPPKADGESE